MENSKLKTFRVKVSKRNSITISKNVLLASNPTKPQTFVVCYEECKGNIYGEDYYVNYGFDADNPKSISLTLRRFNPGDYLILTPMPDEGKLIIELAPVYKIIRD